MTISTGQGDVYKIPCNRLRPPDELQQVGASFRKQGTPVKTVPMESDHEPPAKLRHIDLATARALVWTNDTVGVATVNVVRELWGARGPRKSGPLPVALLYGDIAPSKALNLLVDTLSGSELNALRLFSLPSRAARLLFNHYPLHASARVAGGEILHVLIAGFGTLGQAIALQFMHLAHYGDPRGRITVLDFNPSLTLVLTTFSILSIQFPLCPPVRTIRDLTPLPSPPGACFEIVRYCVSYIICSFVTRR